MLRQEGLSSEGEKDSVVTCSVARSSAQLLNQCTPISNMSIFMTKESRCKLVAGLEVSSLQRWKCHTCAIRHDVNTCTYRVVQKNLAKFNNESFVWADEL